MKNILIQNSSSDGGSYVFIDDLSKLDTFKSKKFLPEEVNIVKDAINFAINTKKTTRFKIESIDYHSGWGDDITVNEGHIYDGYGYLVINILHECFGFKEPPFMVDMMIFVESRT